MPMRELTSRERKTLRGVAHPLEPLVHIGKQGLTEGVFQQIDEQLRHHELIKVKFLAGKEEKRELTEQIAQRLACDVPGVVGHIAILYRQNEDPDERVVDFPNLHAPA